MADTAQFWPNQPSSARIGANRAELAQIREKKKLKRSTDAQATASDSDAAPSQPHPCFPEYDNDSD